MSTAKALAASSYMKRYLGSWYLWGGDGLKRVDCSGLGHRSYLEATGIDISRTTYTQQKRGAKVARSAVRPADGIYLHNDGNGNSQHVIWVVTHDMAIHAPHTGARVEYTNIDNMIRNLGLVTIRRFTPWDSAPHPSARPTLRPGDHGAAVKLMQGYLLHHKVYIGSAGADGIFGPKTKTGLMVFQKNNKLPVNGICDNDDWRALLK